MYFRFLWPTIALSLAIQSVNAQEIAAGSPPPSVLIALAADTRETYVSAIMQPFRKAARDRKTLTWGDIDRAIGRAQASTRADKMEEFFLADVNNDNTLDRQELIDNPMIRELPDQGISTADANADNSVTLDEALAFAQRTAKTRSGASSAAQVRALLNLDPNGDGRLTADELEILALKAFAYFDKDQDDVLSDGERSALLQEISRASKARILGREISQCDYPPPKSNQKVFVVSSYEAGTLSNTSVAGQDQETEVATLNIEPGQERLYIIVSSSTPMIWRLTGSVDRVDQFVGAARGGVGVVGIEKAKAKLIGEYECVRRLEKDTPESRAYLKALSEVLNHRLDGVSFAYTTGNLSVPSQLRTIENWVPDRREKTLAQFTLAGLGTAKFADVIAESKALASLKRFSPGGVADIDPNEVIASEVAERYQVLPQEAGLLQLVENGSLIESKMTYIISKPFPRFPAGLAGAHMTTFILPDGVPKPGGDPGHSQVIVRPRQAQ